MAKATYLEILKVGAQSSGAAQQAASPTDVLSHVLQRNNGLLQKIPSSLIARVRLSATILRLTHSVFMK